MYKAIVDIAGFLWSKEDNGCSWDSIEKDKKDEAYAKVIGECAAWKGAVGWTIEDDEQYISSITNLSAKIAYIAKMAHWCRKRANAIITTTASRRDDPLIHLPRTFATAIGAVYMVHFGGQCGEDRGGRIDKLVNILYSLDPIDGTDSCTKEEAIATFRAFEARRAESMTEDTSRTFVMLEIVDE